MKTAQEINKILDILDEMYPDAECALDYDGSIFKLIVAVVLSAQTTDVSVNKVTPELFKKYPTPFELANAKQEDVEEIIHSIGLYRNKAKNIISLARALCDNFAGEVPNNFDSLVSLPGVGRKTANVVLSVGFGEERIAVDTHVFRVANRIGLSSEKDVQKTEESLMRAIPDGRRSKAHHSLIFHGRNLCSARNPKCENCGLNSLCDSAFEK